MLRISPLRPRRGKTLKVLVLARISGCQNQKELSLEDQEDHARQDIADLYDGPAEFHVIATKGKGERLDRPELAEVEARILQDLDDVVFMEDAGRMIRGTAAVALWGLAVDRGIRCIAPNDGCDTDDETWEEDLISACKDHVSHCSHTSRRIKHKQMNRFRRSGGALPLPVYGYIKPNGAKHYSELRKDESASVHVREGLEVLKRTKNWSAVADYLNRERVPTGPYCRNDQWDSAMARRYYQNPILKGRPQRGARHTTKHHGTGRRISVRNPDGPTHRDEPHLAFFEPAEIDPVLAEMAARNSNRGRTYSAKDVVSPGSGKRSRFPGQCAVCWYCGHNMVWGGNGQRDHLMCNGSRRYKCWNSIGVDGNLAAQRIVEEINKELMQMEEFDAQFRDFISMESQRVDVEAEEQQLAREEAALERERQNVRNAVLNNGDHALLGELLDEVDEREARLILRRQTLENRKRAVPQLPESPSELRKLFDEVSKDLSCDSLEFGDVIRSMVTGFHIYLVRSIDGGKYLPRAVVTLCLGGFSNDIAPQTDFSEFLSRTFTIDIFEPITPIRIREECVRLTEQDTKQRDIARQMNTHQATVQRALKLDRLMKERGLVSPYELVTGPPENGGGTLVRHKHPRYEFTRREGYVSPVIEPLSGSA